MEQHKNLDEDKRFISSLRRKKDWILSHICHRSLLVWGCGQGGVLALNYFPRFGLSIDGFIDNKVEGNMENLPIYKPDYLSNEEHFVIIDCLVPHPEIIDDDICSRKFPRKYRISMESR